MMTAFGVLLVLAALVAVAGAIRRPDRSRLVSFAAVSLCAAAVLLTASGLAAPTPDARPAEPPSEGEKQGLAALHRNTVEIFVARPGFGERRLRLPLADVVGPPESLYDPDETTQGGALPEGKDKKAKPNHYSVQDLVSSGRAGRILTDDKREEWKVLKVQLVGLVKHPDPLVYLTDETPAKKTVAANGEKQTATREPDEFEKAGLESLRRRADLKAEKRGHSMRMLAPIYAGKRCAACHERGQLLGAFSYEMERVAFRSEKARDGLTPRGP